MGVGTVCCGGGDGCWLSVIGGVGGVLSVKSGFGWRVEIGEVVVGWRLLRFVVDSVGLGWLWVVFLVSWKCGGGCREGCRVGMDLEVCEGELARGGFVRLVLVGRSVVGEGRWSVCGMFREWGESVVVGVRGGHGGAWVGGGVVVGGWGCEVVWCGGNSYEVDSGVVGVAEIVGGVGCGVWADRWAVGERLGWMVGSGACGGGGVGWRIVFNGQYWSESGVSEGAEEGEVWRLGVASCGRCGSLLSGQWFVSERLVGWYLEGEGMSIVCIIASLLWGRVGDLFGFEGVWEGLGHMVVGSVGEFGGFFTAWVVFVGRQVRAQRIGCGISFVLDWCFMVSVCLGEAWVKTVWCGVRVWFGGSMCAWLWAVSCQRMGSEVLNSESCGVGWVWAVLAVAGDGGVWLVAFLWLGRCLNGGLGVGVGMAWFCSVGGDGSFPTLVPKADIVGQLWDGGVGWVCVRVGLVVVGVFVGCWYGVSCSVSGMVLVVSVLCVGGLVCWVVAVGCVWEVGLQSVGFEGGRGFGSYCGSGDRRVVAVSLVWSRGGMLFLRGEWGVVTGSRGFSGCGFGNGMGCVCVEGGDGVVGTPCGSLDGGVGGSGSIVQGVLCGGRVLYVGCGVVEGRSVRGGWYGEDGGGFVRCGVVWLRGVERGLTGGEGVCGGDGGSGGGGSFEGGCRGVGGDACARGGVKFFAVSENMGFVECCVDNCSGGKGSLVVEFRGLMVVVLGREWVVGFGGGVWCLVFQVRGFRGVYKGVVSCVRIVGWWGLEYGGCVVGAVVVVNVWGWGFRAGKGLGGWMGRDWRCCLGGAWSGRGVFACGGWVCSVGLSGMWDWGLGVREEDRVVGGRVRVRGDGRGLYCVVCAGVRVCVAVGCGAGGGRGVFGPRSEEGGSCRRRGGVWLGGVVWEVKGSSCGDAVALVGLDWVVSVRFGWGGLDGDILILIKLCCVGWCDGVGMVRGCVGFSGGCMGLDAFAVLGFFGLGLSGCGEGLGYGVGGEGGVGLRIGGLVMGLMDAGRCHGCGG
ncbi:hypothetical protein Tco_0992684 [Tanacetum coccineum]|uniref:Uncharacterized protein n=1 Tax=Tanacetum coccineum TaxID=301880 RepID=A0ABQ5F439_9ASTR